MSPVLTEIRDAMALGASFSVFKDQKNSLHVTKRSIWGRVFFWKEHDYHTQRINRIAKVLNQEIRQLPRTNIKAALQNDTLKVARKFLRSLNPNHFAVSHVNCLQQS